jgi:hypothetical protein
VKPTSQFVYPPATTAGLTDAPTQATAAPTESPASTQTQEGTWIEKIGATATVQNGGVDWVKITVSDVKSATSFLAGNGVIEEPRREGDVFLSARVTYEAVGDGLDYEPDDWDITCDGANASRITVMYGPTPGLTAGTLAKGQTASGYLVYEVPPTGVVEMTYAPTFLNSNPVYEVVLRTQ